ncbi:Amyloid beta A4 precursor protein-binding family A member 2 [Tupaia chinensis]|uniref:Amyloid beta A4 protein-binding family A member 2 n=1 Tax=Tupaia chinensis TaxID=246437 RepID=L8YA72_TUPCH|nr:Amyloid beta A4 precursor protein-binding family A member 2 [Tupaia chinensis]
MAQRERQSAASAMLDHRLRAPEGDDADPPLEGYVPAGLQLATLRPESPTPEGQESRQPSPDGDSSSDYANHSSEEEGYEEGLPEEGGVTYYIRYCPEDDSYLEGADPHDTDECQEAVEDWTDPAGPHALGGGQDFADGHLPAPEDEPSVLEAHGRDVGGHCSPSQEAYQDYYPLEAGGNVGSASPYRSGHGGGDGDLEGREEDIDQIVAEIKMSLSMTSITSASAASPEHTPELRPTACTEACPPGEASRGPSRREARPTSLSLPPETKHPADPQRGFKPKPRTPEERPAWAQEQVCNGPEPPRKQQRSDLNGPVDNNNIPETKKVASFPSFVAAHGNGCDWPSPAGRGSSVAASLMRYMLPSVPGPCEPEDLVDGIIFAANYLGSTQLLSERNPSKNIRMMQAQEAVSRVKNSEGDAQTLTEVDLFISTQRIKVLNADTQQGAVEGDVVAGPRSGVPGPRPAPRPSPTAPQAQLIAQSIGQAFSVAYQEFLRAHGIDPEDLSQREYSDVINTQEMYNDDLVHFSNSDNCKELQLEKLKGETLGVVVVESGWGSILPTVILASMMNGGPAARSGKLSIGDQLMSVNGTSLVGLPLATCQGIIKGLKNQTQVRLNIVSCPPVTTVLIKRPDLKYQLGFSVQNGIICSLMRGGIAERGGVRVGHRIIEINGQSVVATAHEKIVQALSNSVGEIHMKTMPAAMFRLLTGQETPLYI